MTPQEEIKRVLGDVDLRVLAERDISLVEKDVNTLMSLAETSPNRAKILQFAYNLILMHVGWENALGKEEGE